MGFLPRENHTMENNLIEFWDFAAQMSVPLKRKQYIFKKIEIIACFQFFFMA